MMKEGLPKFQLKKMNEISKLIDVYINGNHEKAIQYAYEVYYENFNKNIKEILIKHSPNSKNEDGSFFYTGPKKCQFQ